MRGLKVVTGAGGRRYLYRRVKGRLVPLPDLPETHPEFLRAWAAAETVTPRFQGAPGSIAELAQRYMASGAWRHLAPGTQEVRRRILNTIIQSRGAGLLRDLEPRHIRKDISELPPVPANTRLKVWRALCNFGVASGSMEESPAARVRPYKVTATPHRRWHPEHVAAYRAHWPVGTPQRTAFEVIFWTGARCVDARRLGWRMVRDGWLEFTQAKTGGPVALPFDAPLPGWAAALGADREELLRVLPERADTHFIATREGVPRSVKGISQWMSANARAAGLPDGLTAHGLRDTRCAILAEIGASALRLMTWSGHASLTEAERYIREADRRRAMRGDARRGSGAAPGGA